MHTTKKWYFQFLIVFIIISNLYGVELSLRSSHFTALSLSLSLSLSLLHCSSVCVRCWPRVWHLFAFGLGEEEVREGIQGGVQQRGYGGAARHPGCLLRPYGQIYKMNTTKKWYFPFLTCMDIIYIIWVGSCRWDLHISPLSQSSWLKYSFQKRKRESGEI